MELRKRVTTLLLVKLQARHNSQQKFKNKTTNLIPFLVMCRESHATIMRATFLFARKYNDLLDTNTKNNGAKSTEM